MWLHDYTFAYQSYKRAVNLFQIPNYRNLCVNVQFDREYYVGVVQVVPIIVYDYYEPGKINSFTPQNTEELTTNET